MPFIESSVSAVDSLKEILRMCIIFNSMMSIDIHRAVCHRHPRLNNSLLLSTRTHPTSVVFYRGGLNQGLFPWFN